VPSPPTPAIEPDARRAARFQQQLAEWLVGPPREIAHALTTR